MPALDHLLDYWGASRSDIATAINVPSSHIRRPSPDELDAIETLDRFLLDLHQAEEEDPAQFMSVPLVKGYTATGWRVYAAGGADLLRRHAAGALSAKEMLALFDPDWHVRYWTDYETFEAGDGQLSIRRKSA
jgi:hypothetical protein